MPPYDSQIFASTPSPRLYASSLAVRLREEMHSLDTVAMATAPAQNEREAANALSLQFLDGGGFAIQSNQDGACSATGGGDASGSRFVAKVVNTFITVEPCDQMRSSASGRCRAQSAGPRPTGGLK